MLSAETLDDLRLAAQAAVDKKAFHVVGLEVSQLTSYSDFFLLCSAASERQVGAIVQSIEERLRTNDRRPLHLEGESRAEWVLLDYGDFIVHVFTEEKRAYYALDSLWGDARRLDDTSLGLFDEPTQGSR